MLLRCEFGVEDAAGAARVWAFQGRVLRKGR